jgi:uncharacterized protein (TIGR02452 family)
MRDRNKNIQILEETLAICSRGYYGVNGSRADCKLSKLQMPQAEVILPEDEIPSLDQFGRGFTTDYRCEYGDSFGGARKLAGEGKECILVLNFANAVHPGGGVRNGANAQEEDLCRKSSLLFSLESMQARKFYNYNWKQMTNLGTDAVIITPRVEIIRDDDNELLEDSVVVAVMTCAAPNIRDGIADLTQEEYEKLLYDRIMRMLLVAASRGYNNLVLGAWGCGAFGNDPKTVSDLFKKAADETDGLFETMEFAIIRNDNNPRNYNEFARNFKG